MLKKYLLYIPARIIPAAASLASVALLTRLLGTEEYGVYTLALTVVYTAQAFFNQWLCQGVLRFYPAAEKDGTLPSFLASIGLLLGLTLVLASAALWLLCASNVLSLSHSLLMVVIPVFAVFALQSLALRLPMATINSGRYSVLVIVQTVASVGVAAFVAWKFPKPEYVLVGFTAGYCLALLCDLKSVTAFSRWWKANRHTMRTVFVYGWPISLTTTLAFLAGKIDRFILEDLLGPSAVGAYAAGVSLAEQGIGALFTTLAMVGQPLAFRALASGDKAALQDRLRKNAAMIFGIGIPACVGFIVVSDVLADVFLGAEFRATAKQLMPWIALSALLSGVRAHYIDHAFHLSHKMPYLILTLIPTLALNIALNYILVPRYGIVAAGWSACLSYGFALVGSLLLTRRLFPMPLPYEDILKTLAASLLMVGWIGLASTLPLPAAWMRLLCYLVVGGLSFGICAYLFNISNIRLLMPPIKFPQRKG